MYETFLWKLLSFHTTMILAWFLWGCVLLRGELRKYAKKIKFKNFWERPLFNISEYAFKYTKKRDNLHYNERGKKNWRWHVQPYTFKSDWNSKLLWKFGVDHCTLILALTEPSSLTHILLNCWAELAEPWILFKLILRDFQSSCQIAMLWKMWRYPMPSVDSVLFA